LILYSYFSTKTYFDKQDGQKYFEVKVYHRKKKAIKIKLNSALGQKQKGFDTTTYVS